MNSVGEAPDGSRITGNNLVERYYLSLAAAFVRGRIPDLAEGDPERTFLEGQRRGLKLHKFKRSMELPRVRRVLGLLRALGPTRLVDVGSGRGVFLWPLLDAFPDLPVIAVDRDARQVADIEAVRAGGIERVEGRCLDVERLELPDGSADGVTILEVLEHLDHPERAAAEVVRVARRFVVASVPSKPDDNPGHIHLFSHDRLEEIFVEAGARRVTIEYVRGHAVALAQL
jgi:ubiquinone/menaquinone biosynthesis C-methylase UbiE